MSSFVTRLATRGRQRLRRPGWMELGSGLLAVGLVVAVVAGTLGYHGRPSSKVSLSTGSAWFPSPDAGSVALIDGTTVTRVAEVPVFRPGDSIEAVQAGSGAYVLRPHPGPGGARGRRLAHRRPARSPERARGQPSLAGFHRADHLGSGAQRHRRPAGRPQIPLPPRRAHRLPRARRRPGHRQRRDAVAGRRRPPALAGREQGADQRATERGHVVSTGDGVGPSGGRSIRSTMAPSRSIPARAGPCARVASTRPIPGRFCPVRNRGLPGPSRSRPGPARS